MSASLVPSKVTYGRRNGLGVFTLLFASTVVACGGDSLSTCGIAVLDPIIVIQSAKPIGENEDISTLSLSDLQIDRTPIAPEAVVAPPLSFGVSVDGDSLRCTIQCGFGFDQGHWQLRVAAAGFRDTTLEINAQYATHEGDSCNGALRGPTRIDISLSRLQ